MSLNSKYKLHAKLKNKAYRDAFVSARISQTLALQARVLRQRAGLSQQELAEKLGTSQNGVFRLESPRYGKHNISTLARVASYFDVGLVVRFAPLSEIVDWTLGLNPESIDIPDFSHDRGFLQPEEGVVSAATERSAGQPSHHSLLRSGPAGMSNVFLCTQASQVRSMARGGLSEASGEASPYQHSMAAGSTFQRQAQAPREGLQ
jgi:transcriptional regulator with XRE-family HTH domain